MKLDAGKLLVASSLLARSKVLLARQVVLLPNVFLFVLYLLIVTVLFLLAPAYSVLKPMKSGFITNIDIAAYVFLALAFWGKSWQMRRDLVGVRYSLSQIFSYLAMVLYMSLFVMSSLLCRRLAWGELPVYLTYYCSYFGLFVLALGVVLLLKSANASLADRLNLGYPFCLALLLCMTGFPLATTSWLPLLALPGVFTFMVWRIGDLERKQLEPSLQIDLENTTVEIVQEEGSSAVSVVAPRFKILPWIY